MSGEKPYNLTSHSRGPIPELKLPTGTTVECLQGVHRVAAAKELLPETGWWWVIDIFVTGISPRLQLSLSEEYSKIVNFSDGEIYLKYAAYQGRVHADLDSIMAEKRLLARLHPMKRKNLRRMANKKYLGPFLEELSSLPG
ncbi:hypothetical protein EV126DRAFT_515945 [Verticillium dahliae]|nr:hypothetical protein EV126DRAFT_515945 [Verticillium dahliae]